jgi:hypothetical protein
MKWAAFGMAATAARGVVPSAAEKKASRIIPGKVPEYFTGKLEMKWADAPMIREAASLHPFDLQARMKMAINAMTTCCDPNHGYITYAQVLFDTNPPHMSHHVGDFIDDMGRHTDSLWMIRSATNDKNNDQVVHQFVRNAMDVVDEGVAWNPPEPPFIRWWDKDPGDAPRGRWSHFPEATRVLLGLASYYRATGDPLAEETLRSMTRGFYRIAQKNDKYAWYPDYNYEEIDGQTLPMRVVNGRWQDYPRGAWVKGTVDVSDPIASGTGDMGGNFPAAFVGMILMPLLRRYDDSKDEVAAELAHKLARTVVELMPNFKNNMVHTHTNLSTVSGIFRLGQMFGTPNYQTWAEEMYVHFRRQDFIPSFGWTPENTSRPRVKDRLCCEACTTTDYLETALQLALYRNEKYWDDAERIAMNQLLEGQMLRTDFVERIPPSAIRSLPNEPAWFFTTDHVVERALGGFGILAGPNDWVQLGEGVQSLQCCFGSGPRGLYDAWYFSAQEESDTLRVNLQFSKRLPSAVVTSYMPGKPVVEVEMTKPKKLLVRKPAWAAVEECRILVNGKPQPGRLKGTYFDLGPREAGSLVRVEFPDKIAHKKERIGEVEFATTWRGNAVIRMEPAGEIYPLYQNRDRQDGVKPLPFISSRPINPL